MAITIDLPEGNEAEITAEVTVKIRWREPTRIDLTSKLIDLRTRLAYNLNKDVNVLLDKYREEVNEIGNN